METLSDKKSEILLNDEDHAVKTDVTDIIGKYGPWQRLIFMLTCLRGIPTAFFNLSTPFFAPEFNIWCAPPNDLKNISSEDWKNILNISAHHSEPGINVRCEMFDVQLTVDQKFIINSNKTIPCSSWVYDNSFYSSTIIQEFDLVCERDWLISFTQSLYMAGMMVGVFFFGHLADRFGRQPVIRFCVVLMMCSGVATAFSPNFMLFSVFRFSLALGVSGVQATTFSLLMEILGPEYRTHVTFAFSFGWAFGCLLLPGLAYCVTNWKHLQLIFMLLTSMVLCYLCVIPESPRWLITQRRYEEAQKLMEKAMHKNKIKISNMSDIYVKLQERIEREKHKINPTIIDLFRTSRLRKYTICIYLIYFSTSFVFYGFVLAQPRLGLNPFLSFLIGTLVEMIAYFLCIPFTKYLYRRTSMLLFTVPGALACFCVILLPKGYFWIRFTSAMIGKMCISGALTLIAIQGGEIFPTVIRTVGSGSSLMIGRIGAMTAPFIKELGEISHESVPTIVFGLLSVLASVMVYLLPETFNKVLPDTIEEADKEKE